MYVCSSHEQHVSKHCQVTVYTISRWSCVCRKVLMTQRLTRTTQWQHNAILSKLSNCVHNTCYVDIRVSRQMVMWTKHYDCKYGTGIVATDYYQAQTENWRTRYSHSLIMCWVSRLTTTFHSWLHMGIRQLHSAQLTTHPMLGVWNICPPLAR